jgi:hypothetical protein
MLWPTSLAFSLMVDMLSSFGLVETSELRGIECNPHAERFTAECQCNQPPLPWPNKV